MLAVAAVIGREFELDQLSHVIDDSSTEELLEVLEEARAGKVIEELPNEVGRYQFAHSLVQHILVEELSTTRRVRLHANIAEALEALWGDEVENHAAALAHHFSESAMETGAQKSRRYSQLADIHYAIRWCKTQAAV